MYEHYEDDEIFRDIDSFYKRLMKRMFHEVRDFERAVNSGQLKGQWDVKPIERPGVKGYVARGRFQLGDGSLRSPRQAIEEQRDPLTDVFEEKDNIKIYMELPGVDKSDIQLNVTDSYAEVRAKNFFKTVELPKRSIDFDKASASYNNGVLEISVPKIQKTAPEEKKRTIKIE